MQLVIHVCVYIAISCETTCLIKFPIFAQTLQFFSSRLLVGGPK